MEKHTQVLCQVFVVGIGDQLGLLKEKETTLKEYKLFIVLLT